MNEANVWLNDSRWINWRNVDINGVNKTTRGVISFGKVPAYTNVYI